MSLYQTISYEDCLAETESQGVKLPKLFGFAGWEIVTYVPAQASDEDLQRYQSQIPRLPSYATHEIVRVKDIPPVYLSDSWKDDLTKNVSYGKLDPLWLLP